jgi:DNA-binding PadR family transcriptional regulator
MPRVNKDAKKIEEFILKNIHKHSSDIVAVASNKFSVSRTTIHRFLNKLVSKGIIIKTGTTNRIIYSLKDEKNRTMEFKLSEGMGEDAVWSKYLKLDFINLKSNIYEIFQYGFTEIFNNVLDHSEGSNAKVITNWDKDIVEIKIIDNGIGAFKKIKDEINLEDERESIFQLSKGKLTTDPKRHSGEGVFFTSRAFDEFNLEANGFIYTVINTEDKRDWFMRRSEKEPDNKKNKNKKLGTSVSMKISIKNVKKLKDIFEEHYTNPENYKFDKTQIVVKLSKFEEEMFISRSQAKRVVFGLEKFREIILDFSEIKSVGQGFVDEVFRVFKSKYPEIEIKYINANEDLEFMIKRGTY